MWQGGAFLPNFVLIAASMLGVFGTLRLTDGPRIEEDESMMSPRRLFLVMGLFQAIKYPCTVFLPFSFQCMAELGVVITRVKVHHEPQGRELDLCFDSLSLRFISYSFESRD
ncbi:hypothetical protein ElyMa_006857900 [Elysia marginata]|uniref:Uncharacterized protein n=1 Tax=Elysia marginata TaxID=1093978 RepID=A0AAV4JBJ5_9GAST|nr:hypothetical protein ElyMa_006857900 [Elysia marginata]